ncbi:hypothetical protein Q8F55_007799 [Vanrija albida]|uniref:Uncharacterized protein n=1 Tax=Vanrija albida TaxID=181172 RepID=A0ABR3PUJ6_9TREE
MPPPTAAMLEAAAQWPWLNLSASAIPDILECRAAQQQRACTATGAGAAPLHTPVSSFPSSPSAVATAVPAAAPCNPAAARPTLSSLPTAPIPPIPADAARQRLYLQQLVRAAYAATLKTNTGTALTQSLGESASKLEAFAAALRAQDCMQRAKMDRIRDWARDVAAATTAAGTEVTPTASHFGVVGGSRSVANTEGTDSEKRTLAEAISEPVQPTEWLVDFPTASPAAQTL